MEKQEKTLQPKESIEIIQKMMTASRKQFADNGAHMVLWAIILIFAGLTNYFLHLSNVASANLAEWTTAVWIAFPIIGGILSIFIGRNQAKDQKVTTAMNRILKFMWIGYGVVLFFVIFFSIKNRLSPSPFIMLFTSFAVFIYGLGVKYTPFIVGSICFLILGVFAFIITPNINELLLFSLSIIAGYLIPGLMLYKKVKHQKDTENV